MYIVTIENNDRSSKIHDGKRKLSSGSIVKGINTIDSFSFTVSPSNPYFSSLYDFKTLVKVYNTSKNRYEFYGRVLCSDTEMSDSGLIRKSVTCESYLGFLCDSQQTYVAERNWTVRGLFEHIITKHNSQVEDYKKFVVGNVTVTDPNDNLYLGIQYEGTWETIQHKLIEKLGGELQFRVVDDVTYIDYLEQIGETKSTAIELSKNMKSIRKEKDPSAYITRLIPLGHKLIVPVTDVDDEGNITTKDQEIEERLNISGVNGGKNYIDDEQAIEAYGLHVGYQIFEDVTSASILKSKGESWLAENNKVQVKYSISALDLSLLGLVIDDFEVGNYHPIINKLLGIDDVARIIKKTIDICTEVNSTFEIGDSFKTLSDIQLEQSNQIAATIGKIEADYVTNQKLTSETRLLNSLIKQTAEEIKLSVSENYTTIEGQEQFEQSVETRLDMLSDEISMNFTTTTTQIYEVDGELQTKFNEIYEYIRFSNGAITLGASDSAITLMIENDQIAFKKNGVTFGYWDGDNFYTGNIIVRLDERLQIGDFAYVPRSDGSVMLLKVGG